MTRRGSFTSFANAVLRDIARAQRLAEAERKRNEREEIRMQKEEMRCEKQRYLENRIAEVADKNNSIKEYLSELESILAKALLSDTAKIDFDELRIKEPPPKFSLPKSIATSQIIPVKEEFLSSIKIVWTFTGLCLLAKIIPILTKYYEESLSEAESEYKIALAAWEAVESERKEKIRKLQNDFAKSLEEFNTKVQTRDAEVYEFKKAYFAGKPDAVADFNNTLLEYSLYPDGFPQDFRTAYSPESKQLVIDYQLPNPTIIPSVEEYRYIRSKDQIEQKNRKPADIRNRYQDVIASVTLRTCHEIFKADQANVVAVLVFNGFLRTVDPATGNNIHPYLVSVRVTKESFGKINLANVNKLVCLKNLGAQVSSQPNEIQAVKPIIEFDMIDKRFVEQGNMLSDIDSKPNLMDLNPFEFETLCANLFSKLGLETKLTRSSRDGGVDAVAYDARPVLGGKVVIQAKRYKNTVGVSAVRDLYGTMLNEGANKGILVTTSGYGPDAFEFAKDKPIELIDGGQLLFLLNQVGVNARIIFPVS